MFGVSLRRALAIVATVLVLAGTVTAVSLQIIWPWTHDGAHSPSELVHSTFDPKKRERVWVAGVVTTCHTEPGSASVTYTLANDIGRDPARVEVQWQSSDGATFGVGARVGFSGERISPAFVLADGVLFAEQRD